MIIADLLKELNLPQNQFAAKLGVSRQYVSAVIKDREELTEERLKLVSKVAPNPDEFLAQVRKSQTWVRSPEGEVHQMKARRSAVMAAYTMRGPRTLTAHEIVEAIDVEIITITRESNDPLDNELEIGVLLEAKSSVTCHFGGIVGISESPSKPEPTTLSAKELRLHSTVIAPQSTLLVRTEEKFKLGSLATLQFNGILRDLRFKGLRAYCELISHFDGSEDDLLISIDNVSSKEFILHAGLPIASVNVIFNPFAGTDD
jgi:plasmid maintenance system antidote protein VapI